MGLGTIAHGSIENYSHRQENSRDGEKQSEERRSARQRGELRLEGRGSWKGMKKYPERVLRTGR